MTMSESETCVAEFVDLFVDFVEFVDLIVFKFLSASVFFFFFLCFVFASELYYYLSQQGYKRTLDLNQLSLRRQVIGVVVYEFGLK